MNLPFVTRKRYERERGRTIVYFPVEYPKDSNGESVMVLPKGYVSGPTMTGEYRKLWAYRKEFKNYDEYIKYLKEIEENA